MTARDEPIPRKKKGKSQSKNPKSDKDTEVPKDKELTYGIEHLNLVDPAVESENESEWLLIQRREGHMSHIKYRNNSIKHECNVLSKTFNPEKRARKKKVITHQSSRDV